MLTSENNPVFLLIFHNSLIIHPVQTWEWGDFQMTQGHTIYRLGVFDDNYKIISAYSGSFHKIPKTKFSILLN